MRSQASLLLLLQATGLALGAPTVFRRDRIGLTSVAQASCSSEAQDSSSHLHGAVQLCLRMTLSDISTGPLTPSSVELIKCHDEDAVSSQSAAEPSGTQSRHPSHVNAQKPSTKNAGTKVNDSPNPNANPHAHDSRPNKPSNSPNHDSKANQGTPKTDPQSKKPSHSISTQAPRSTHPTTSLRHTKTTHSTSPRPTHTPLGEPDSSHSQPGVSGNQQYAKPTTSTPSPAPSHSAVSNQPSTHSSGPEPSNGSPSEPSSSGPNKGSTPSHPPMSSSTESASNASNPGPDKGSASSQSSSGPKKGSTSETPSPGPEKEPSSSSPAPGSKAGSPSDSDSDDGAAGVPKINLDRLQPLVEVKANGKALDDAKDGDGVLKNLGSKAAVHQESVADPTNRLPSPSSIKQVADINASVIKNPGPSDTVSSSDAKVNNIKDSTISQAVPKEVGHSPADDRVGQLPTDETASQPAAETLDSKIHDPARVDVHVSVIKDDLAPGL